MDNFEQNETHYVRCLKCSKILKCSRYDTNALLEHIRTDHPEIEIVENNNKNPNNNNSNTVNPAHTKKPNNNPTEKPKKNEKPKNVEQKPDAKCPRAPSPCSKLDNENVRKDGPLLIECSICDQSQESDSIFKQRPPASPQRANPDECIKRRRVRSRSKYRTSIERWRPANGTLYCPKCGQTRRPLIRSHSERITDNSCAAACLLSCWPLCFLPFLIPNSNTEYLHCPNCKNFLGLYDRTNNCIKPNREFVPTTDTESHKS